MRVPTNSNSEQIISRISELSANQSRLQTKVSTGQRIFNASDDPAAMGRILTLQNEQSSLSQYKTNTSFALDISNATYSGLTQVKKISDRIGELATLADGNVGQDAMNSYAEEVDQLIDQTLQLANSKLRNDYIFAGDELSGTVAHPAPYELNGTTGYYEYWGSANQVSIPISENSAITPGTDATTNGELRDFLNNMVDLRDALMAGDTASLSTVRTALEGSENQLVSAISSQGAIQSRIDIVNTQRTERLDNIESLISKERDVEMAETITRLNQSSVAYQAALSSAAQIMKVSLLDYI